MTFWISYRKTTDNVLSVNTIPRDSIAIPGIAIESLYLAGSKKKSVILTQCDGTLSYKTQLLRESQALNNHRRYITAVWNLSFRFTGISCTFTDLTDTLQRKKPNSIKDSFNIRFNHFFWQQVQLSSKDNKIRSHPRVLVKKAASFWFTKTFLSLRRLLQFYNLEIPMYLTSCVS